MVRGDDVLNVILRGGQVLRGPTLLEQPHSIQWMLPFCICWVKQGWLYYLFHFPRNQAQLRKVPDITQSLFGTFSTLFSSLVSPVHIWLTLSFFLSWYSSWPRRKRCLGHGCVARTAPDLWFHPIYGWQHPESTKVSVTVNIYMSLCLCGWRSWTSGWLHLSVPNSALSSGLRNKGPDLFVRVQKRKSLQPVPLTPAFNLPWELQD